MHLQGITLSLLTLLTSISSTALAQSHHDRSTPDLEGHTEQQSTPPQGWKTTHYKRLATAKFLSALDTYDSAKASAATLAPLTQIHPSLSRRSAMNVEGSGRALMDSTMDLISIARTGCPANTRESMSDARECRACKKAKAEGRLRRRDAEAEAEPEADPEARGGGGGRRGGGGGGGGGGGKGGAKADTGGKKDKKKVTFKMGGQEMDADCSLYNV